MDDILFDLYYSAVHRNEELEKTIKDLQRNINDLQSELAGATNDYKQATNEIKLLNKQIDRHITAVNDLTDIVDTSHKVIAVLEKENIMLRHALNEVINNDSNY